jgi:hypothetical protein
MMVALDLLKRISESLQEIFVGVQNFPSMLNSMTACTLLTALIIPMVATSADTRPNPLKADFAIASIMPPLLTLRVSIRAPISLDSER